MFPTIDVTAAGVRIGDRLLETLTISALTELFGEPRVVAPDSPGPDDRGLVRSTLMVWDDLGLRAYTKGEDRASELWIQFADDSDHEVKPEARKFFPSGSFPGTLTIDGRAPIDAVPDSELRKAYIFVSASAGHWESTFRLNDSECGEIREMSIKERLHKSETDEIANIIKRAQQPFRDVSIGYRPPPVVKRSSGKWKLKAADEPVLQIASFPFRLAIIQELMYEQDVLTPRFDVHDFSQDQGARSFDVDEVGYDMIPSVRSWLRKVPIPARLADNVETLVLDGGNHIYLQLIPFWDGEDESFAIRSLSEGDLDLFPRLRSINDIGGFLGPRARSALLKRGIEVE
jgi:hypothetical protein